MSKEKYLITGANGFIGANLAHYLTEHDLLVVAAVRDLSNTWRLESINGLEFAQVDIVDRVSVRELLQLTRPTHIFHLATYGVYRDQKRPDLIFNTNVLGTFNLLSEAINLELDAFINTGSVYEYSNLPGKQIETVTGIPRNIYDAAKLNSTAMSQAFAAEYNLPVTTLRLFTTYGPWEDNRRLVSSTISKLFNGERPIIASSAIRDFIHADDVSRAYIAASRKAQSGEIYNIGSGVPTQVGQLVSTLCELINPEITPIESQTYLPTNDSQCWAGIEKATTELGWEPQMSLEQGLLKTVEWYKNYQNH